jgi:hypothetical protein
MPIYVWPIFVVAMLGVFAWMYMKAALKAVGVERGLAVFDVTACPARIMRHTRRIFTTYRNACVEEGRRPVLAWVANAALILALLGAAAGLAQWIFF